MGFDKGVREFCFWVFGFRPFRSQDRRFSHVCCFVCGGGGVDLGSHMFSYPKC